MINHFVQISALYRALFGTAREINHQANDINVYLKIIKSYFKIKNGNKTGINMRYNKKTK